MKKIVSIKLKREEDLDPDTSYLDQAEELAERKLKWVNGDFHHIGIWARAGVAVNSTIQEICSGGLWGIENDSDKAYIEKIEDQELEQLKEILLELGFPLEEIQTAIFKAVSHR